MKLHCVKSFSVNQWETRFADHQELEMLVRLNATLCTFPKSYITKKKHFFMSQLFKVWELLTSSRGVFTTSGDRVALVHARDMYGSTNDPRTANDPGPQMIPKLDRK